jgi:hypothetical protein
MKKCWVNTTIGLQQFCVLCATHATTEMKQLNLSKIFMEEQTYMCSYMTPDFGRQKKEEMRRIEAHKWMSSEWPIHRTT